MRLRHGLLLAALAMLAFMAWRWLAPMPALKDGDIVFQTSRSRQSAAIMAATHSLYSHMGIVRLTANGPVVIEAVGPVKETALKAWVKRGRLGRIAVYRDPSLTTAQTKQVFAAAKTLYGRPYDLYFSFGRDSIYCSELVRDAYGEAGVDLGRVQTIRDLGANSGLARGLLERRADADPQCRAEGLKGPACVDRVLERQLVTPVSIARDGKLKRVYSNYPF